MLARRLIPCLDVAGGRVVKGVHFRELRDAGDPVDQAARYDAAGADEVVLLDIDASPEERGTLIDLVSRVADRLFVPFTVGGGIRSVADARQVLRAGADKVAVNTAAVRDPSLVTRLADEFGRQCVVAAVDVKGREGGRGKGGGWEVMVRGGREPTGLEAVEWAVRLQELGAWDIRSARESVLSPHLPRRAQYPEGARGDVRSGGASRGTPGRGPHGGVGALRAPPGE